jgi:hypothetical protein
MPLIHHTSRASNSPRDLVLCKTFKQRHCAARNRQGWNCELQLACAAGQEPPAAQELQHEQGMASTETHLLEASSCGGSSAACGRCRNGYGSAQG